MHAKVIKKNWEEIKGNVKQQWNRLTDVDIERIQGQYHRLIDLIVEKYGDTKEQAEKRIAEFVDMLKSSGILLQNKTKKLISDNPMAAIGTALAVGASLAYFLQRKFRRE